MSASTNSKARTLRDIRQPVSLEAHRIIVVEVVDADDAGDRREEAVARDAIR